MNIIKPKNLKSGDNIAIIAPSGILDREKFLLGIENFKKLGFRPVYNERIFEKKRYLAGCDDEKVAEIENYFKNPEIQGIICARGGYGTLRLINKIDYKIVKDNPKYFGGYSDITILQLMFLKHAGLVTYTSPMIQPDFGDDEVCEFTVNKFLSPPKQIECKIIQSGKAEGILWGGNLASISSLCGVDFLPDKDFIFFTEDICEPSYKIDRMLQQLLNIDKFRKHIKGIVFGEFKGCDKDDFLKDLENEFALTLNIPAFENLNITHSKTKLTLPIGVDAKICDGQLFL